MEQATKKKLLIGGALLVVAGVGGYFLYKFLKGKAEKKRLEEEQKKLQQQQQTPPLGSTGGSTTPSSGGGTTPPSDRPANIMDFQRFAKKLGENLGTSGPNKDGVDGVWGSKTAAAWTKLKKAYNDSLAQASKVFATTSDLLAANINGANGKDIYTTVDSDIFNMDNKLAGKVKANTRLGKVVSAKKGTSTYSVIFKADTGVNYWTTSFGTKIDVTPTSSFEGMTVSYLGSDL